MSLGAIMMGSFIGGAVANSVIDTINVTNNCAVADSMNKSMDKMHEFYKSISDENTVNQEKCNKLVEDLKSKHKEHKLVIDDYLKNNKDRIRRTEIILVTSLSVIIVNFIIKSNIIQNTYDYFFSKK